MMKRGQNAFPAEPVERPEQQNVELPPAGILEHLLKLGAVGNLAGFVIDLLGGNGSALLMANSRSWRSWFSVSWPLSLVETRAYSATRIVSGLVEN